MPPHTISPASRVSSREIWNLTWPQILMMLFQFLVGFTDVVVAGRIHPNVQAAFGIIIQCQFTLLVVGMALSNGGIAAMSQSLGAGMPLRAERYAGLMTTLALSLCGLIVLLGWVLRDIIFSLLSVPQDLLPLTNELWAVVLWVIPANYLAIQTMAIFRSRKNVLIPLASGMIMCVLNAIGDFGFGLGMFGLPNFGAQGIIVSSLVAVSAGALFNCFMLYKKGYISAKAFAPLRWQKKAAPYLLRVALPSGGMQVLWQLGYLVLFTITATLPYARETALAGLTAGMRIESLLFLPAMAFSATGSVLVGHCLGAGNPAEAKRVGLRVAATGALLMSLVAAIMFPFVPAISAFVAPDAAVQAQAISYMRYNLLSTPFTVTSMVMTGILTGAGATLYPMKVNSMSIWLVRLPLAWFLGHILWQDAAGVFCAMLISQCVGAAAHYYVFLRLNWYRFALTAKRTQRA